LIGLKTMSTEGMNLNQWSEHYKWDF